MKAVAAKQPVSPARRGYRDANVEAFFRAFGDIVVAIGDPTSFAYALYSAGLIRRAASVPNLSILLATEVGGNYKSREIWTTRVRLQKWRVLSLFYVLFFVRRSSIHSCVMELCL